jgi:hypothetical protein
MRSPKLIPVLAAASALLVLAPAGANARPAGQKQLKNASPNGRCKVSEIIEPRTITAGETAQIFGQLLCTAGSNEGQTISVYARPAGSSTFKVIGEAKTVAGGLYSFVTPAISTDTRFYVRAATRHSPTKAVRVAPVVKLEGPPEKTELKTGGKNAVPFKVTTSPAATGAEVLLEREQATSSEEWQVIQKGIVGPGGIVTLVHSFGAPGDVNLRALVRPRGTTFTVRGVSELRNYLVAQPQNPNLTIESSANPISFGTPITIKGVVKGGAGKPVTLLARKKGSSSALAPVMSTTAGVEGKYEFVQTPLTSTFYRVTAGGLNSRRLFEGVKYILTAAVSAKTIQSGQPLTFAGTVTPAKAGKTVYLQRENTFGGGFHIIDVGTVSAGGTYSITHNVFGPAKAANFRIKVPGDSENQAVSSAPFSIEVTLAPPSALHPAAQGKQPH